MSDLSLIVQGLGATGAGGVILALAYVLRPVILQALGDMRERRQAAAEERAQLRADVAAAVAASERWQESERECQERLQALSAELASVRSRTDEVSLQLTGLMSDDWPRARG